MKKIITLIICLILLTTLSFSQNNTRSYLNDALLAPRDHNVDFQNLKLEVSFEPATNLVKGKVTHTFIPLQERVDSITLDGIKMDIKSILLNGKEARYRNDDEKVIIYTPLLTWGHKDSLVITYECRPRKGLYFIGWNDDANICRKQIWSQGQGIDNRNWIPMYDEMNDKITTDMIVTFDTAYKVLSNGKMINKKINKNGTNTWHYKMTRPYAPYLIMLGIGKYDIKQTKSASGIPINLWYYPEWKDRVNTTYKESERIFDFYEKEIGIGYPWESYSQIPVQDFMYGAMENTTATLFGDFYFTDERGLLDRTYVGTNAHELAHQWFGDYITARSDAHHWLQESFATYYNTMAEKEVFGKNFFDWDRREEQIESLNESKKNDFPVAHSEAGGVRHYPKGSFVLYMLNNVLGGRETFNKCIKHYLTKHGYNSVDSHDLLIACEEVTGMQLDWFWEEWIYKGGEPHYNVSFRDITENSMSKGLSHYSEFVVQQVQDLTEITGLPKSLENKSNSVSIDPFIQETKGTANAPAGLWKMPIWFEVRYTDGTADRKLATIQKQTEIVRIAIPEGKKIDFVLFDPNNEVLKSVSFNKSFEMLKAQAMNASNLLDEYDALAAMKNTDIQDKRAFLISYYRMTDKANFHPLKTEIISQLLNDKSQQSKEIIKAGLSDGDVKVRKYMIDHFSDLPKELLPEVEKLLKDPSYEVITKTLEYLYLAYPDKIESYLEQTKDVEGMPGKNVKVKWLEIACLNNAKYVDQLVSYCSSSYEFITRTNAMSSLKRINYFDNPAIEYVIDGMLSANYRLSRPATETLRFFYTQSVYRRMINNYVNSREWQPWEKEVIKKVVS